jgi:hypothetical protein
MPCVQQQLGGAIHSALHLPGQASWRQTRRQINLRGLPGALPGNIKQRDRPKRCAATPKTRRILAPAAA